MCALAAPPVFAYGGIYDSLLAEIPDEEAILARMYVKVNKDTIISSETMLLTISECRLCVFPCPGICRRCIDIAKKNHNGNERYYYDECSKYCFFHILDFSVSMMILSITSIALCSSWISSSIHYHLGVANMSVFLHDDRRRRCTYSSA